jgi:hypothetical protein
MSGAKTGKPGKLKISPPELFIETIRFEGQIPIWYCRIPDKRITYVVPPAGTEHTLHTPPEIMPVTGNPHWKRYAGTTQEEISWPAAYVRDGLATGTIARRLHVVFSTSNPAFNGSIIIKADSDHSIAIAENTVSFTSGRSAEISFDLQNLPKTVRWLSGLTFHWQYRSSTNPNFIPAHDTRHTLFILDALPLRANLDGNDFFIFEILDWACRWASNKAGSADVLAAIWRHFNPVRAEHDTGLVYWKNHHIESVRRQMAQRIVDAILIKYDSNPLLRNAASCIVFDRIFMNCLLAHGISCAEIMVTGNPASFSRSGTNYSLQRWMAKSIIAQGNIDSPTGWGNHWIADVADSIGNWHIYDPSYGAAPYATDNPNISNIVSLTQYEREAVASFECEDNRTMTIVYLPLDPAQDPHLKGDVLWPP